MKLKAVLRLKTLKIIVIILIIFLITYFSGLAAAVFFIV